MNILGLPIAVVVILALVVLMFIVGLITLISKYKTVSPDQAMIITGSYLGNKNVVASEAGDRKVKIISGGGSFIIPIFQQGQMISLLSHKLDVSTPEVYTEQGVPVLADATAIIKIGSTTNEIYTAAEQFLGKPEETLRGEAREVLEGHLRSILGSMTVEEIYRNRDKFASSVQEVAAKDLKKMGLQIVSFTIKDVRDKHGYLDALGKPRIAAVKRDAQIAEAEADKEASVKRAVADEESRKAQLLMETNVAEATKAKELKVATFKLEQDRAKAEADLAYDTQAAISRQHVIEAEMKAKQTQMERDIELAEKEIIRKEKEYEATFKKKADAELYVRQQEAEAEKYEQETRAQAEAEKVRLAALADAAANEAKAKAEAEADRARGEASAAVERAKGQAVADAEKAKTEIVRAKGEMEAAAERARIDNLEAAGQAEAAAIEAKGRAEAVVAREKAQVEVNREMGLAEAALKAGELKVVEMLSKALPEIAGQIAAPMGNIDKVTIVDTGGDGDGVGKMTNTVTNLMHTLPAVVQNLTGVNLADVLANISNGRFSGQAYDPESFQSLLKVAKNVDPDTVKQLLEMANKEEQ